MPSGLGDGDAGAGGLKRSWIGVATGWRQQMHNRKRSARRWRTCRAASAFACAGLFRTVLPRAVPARADTSGSKDPGVDHLTVNGPRGKSRATDAGLGFLQVAF